MPRRPRNATGGYVFHVLNRAVGRQTIFADDDDFEAFQRVLQEAGTRVPMRLLAYCVMPNHWHLILWPINDDDLSEFMRWLTVTHTQRWQVAHGAVGTGPIYQGRFKSFPVEGDDHFYRVCRYVERNALRARLVTRAERWRWTSLWQLSQERYDVALHQWPLPRNSRWIEYVNAAETESELAAIRASVTSGRPYGNMAWIRETAQRLTLDRYCEREEGDGESKFE